METGSPCGRVQPNGTKTWLFRYRRPGTAKENFLSLGPYPDITLVDARRSATTARNLVREGIDPVACRRAESIARNLATKARQYVGGIVTYAVQNGLREDGAALALRGVVPRHGKRHIPAITKPADIGPLVLAIDAYKSPITRAALKLTMLTGLRPGVVAAVPWDEVNLRTAEWHVAADENDLVWISMYWKRNWHTPSVAMCKRPTTELRLMMIVAA